MTILPHVDAPIHLLANFAEAYPESTSEFTLHVPGRSLWVAGCRRRDRQFRLASVEMGSRTALTYQSAKMRQTVIRRPLPAWALYAAAMAVYLADKGVDCGGFNIVIAGTEGTTTRYTYAVGAAFGAAYYGTMGIPYSEATLMDDLDHARRAVES
jgi:hypothetical protein